MGYFAVYAVLSLRRVLSVAGVHSAGGRLAGSILESGGECAMNPTDAELRTRKFPMFGGAASHTLDELVEMMVPELTTGTKRRKMSRYQALHRAFTKMLYGLGLDLLQPEAWYVVFQAADRAARFNDALIPEPDNEEVEAVQQERERCIQVAKSVLTETCGCGAVVERALREGVGDDGSVLGVAMEDAAPMEPFCVKIPRAPNQA